MSTKPWTKDEIQFLYNGRLQHKSYRIIAAELGRSEEACRCKHRDADYVALGVYDTVAEENHFIQKSEFTQKQYNTLDKKLDAFKLQTDALVDVIESAVDKLPPIPKPTFKPTHARKNHTEDVGLLLSDLHIGQEHSLEETSGISEYNLDVFKRRLNNLEYAMQDIVQLHSQMYKLPKLHIMCLGDIVAGMNAAGAWSPLYIASPIVDQVLLGVHHLTGMIYKWLNLFEEIHFYGIVGNHGRSAPQGVQKDHDNWDYVCYKFLQTAFQNNKRVVFHVPKSWFIMERIRDHNFLMVHGDYIKGGANPIKGLANFEQRMMQILKIIPDYTVAGHFHNTSEMNSNSSRLILNGSFVGSDVYSLKTCHAGSPPEQKLFGISDRHGITWTYNINLDIPRVEK